MLFLVRVKGTPSPHFPTDYHIVKMKLRWERSQNLCFFYVVEILKEGPFRNKNWNFISFAKHSAIYLYHEPWIFFLINGNKGYLWCSWVRTKWWGLIPDVINSFTMQFEKFTVRINQFGFAAARYRFDWKSKSFWARNNRTQTSNSVNRKLAKVSSYGEHKIIFNALLHYVLSNLNFLWVRKWTLMVRGRNDMILF